MKKLNQYILEKLKISKSNAFVTPTYKEFFDLLSEYSEKNGEGLLDLNEIINDDESLPKYKNNESEHIYTLTPLHSSSPILRLRMYDFELKHSLSHNIYINDVANEEVDFMEDEAIEKTVKYMKEHIK